ARVRGVIANPVAVSQSSALRELVHHGLAAAAQAIEVLVPLESSAITYAPPGSCRSCGLFCRVWGLSSYGGCAVLSRCAPVRRSGKALRRYRRSAGSCGQLPIATANEL